MQTICTILDNRPILQHSRPGVKHPPSSPDLEARLEEEGLWTEAKESWKDEMQKLDIPSKLLPKKDRAGARAGTLVICPVIALYQWKTEIEKFTDNEKTLTVGTYHGPNRAKEMPHEMMSKYDVILTTYQCLEQDFRKMMSPNKVACPNCGGKFKLDKLRVHLKYFCGESAQRTEAQARQRRTADRNRHGGTRPSDGPDGKGSSKKKPKLSQKPPMTKVVPKKTIRVKGDDTYDTDSDLSLPDEVVSVGRKRPTRSGAKQTAQKIAKSIKASGGANDSDESDFSMDNESDASDDSSSSADMKLASLKKTKPKAAPRKTGASTAAERAREKQRQALEATRRKGTDSKKKKFPAKKGKGKKFDESSESSGDDTNAGAGNGGGDPMDDIDMDELLKEAMSGARFSILHSFCWWRVVLDEAHFIKSRSSQTAAAAFSLSSIHRWCLSGTPLQNRVGERKFLSCKFNLSTSPSLQNVCRPSHLQYIV